MKFSKSVVAIAIVALLIGAGMFVAFRSSAQTSCSTATYKPTIIAFGDSLVAGYGAPEGSGFVEKLSEKIGIPVTNYGRNGDTSAQGLARARALSDRPDIVIILLGGNDALQKVSVTETKANLSALIELFQSYQSKRIHVVLVGVMGGFPSDPYASMFKELAKEHGVTYVPNALAGLFGNQDLMSDQVHPNAVGYEKLAERLVPVLNNECKAVASER